MKYHQIQYTNLLLICLHLIYVTKLFKYWLKLDIQNINIWSFSRNCIKVGYILTVISIRLNSYIYISTPHTASQNISTHLTHSIYGMNWTAHILYPTHIHINFSLRVCISVYRHHKSRMPHRKLNISFTALLYVWYSACPI